MAESSAHIPTVTIGLPVYNASNYLEESIKSILAQSFTDFELIISDNASTDNTEEIARRFADADDRIRYFRNSTNIGGANNQNLTVQRARGRYFRLAAHDDIMAPTLLEECLATLDSRPEVVLCYPATIDIDSEGNPMGQHTVGRGMARRPSERFAEFAFRDYKCEATYGVIRTEVLKNTRPMGNFTDSDRVFLCSLALQGPFHELSKPLYYRRQHPKNMYLDWRARMAWYDPSKKGRITFPNWIELREFVRLVATAKIDAWERCRCAMTVVRWTVRYSPNLAKDLFVAAKAAIGLRPSKKSDKSLYNWE